MQEAAQAQQCLLAANLKKVLSASEQGDCGTQQDAPNRRGPVYSQEPAPEPRPVNEMPTADKVLQVDLVLDHISQALSVMDILSLEAAQPTLRAPLAPMWMRAASKELPGFVFGPGLADCTSIAERQKLIKALSRTAMLPGVGVQIPDFEAATVLLRAVLRAQKSVVEHGLACNGSAKVAVVRLRTRDFDSKKGWSDEDDDVDDLSDSSSDAESESDLDDESSSLETLKDAPPSLVSRRWSSALNEAFRRHGNNHASMHSDRYVVDAHFIDGKQGSLSGIRVCVPRLRNCEQRAQLCGESAMLLSKVCAPALGERSAVAVLCVRDLIPQRSRVNLSAARAYRMTDSPALSFCKRTSLPSHHVGGRPWPNATREIRA